MRLVVHDKANGIAELRNDLTKTKKYDNVRLN